MKIVFLRFGKETPARGTRIYAFTFMYFWERSIKGAKECETARD
jgi:hypothetical protein